jgi:hypothetical protein
MFDLLKPKKTIEAKKAELKAIDPTLDECGDYLRGRCPSCVDCTGQAYNLIISFRDDWVMCYNCARWCSVDAFKAALPQALRLRAVMRLD